MTHPLRRILIADDHDVMRRGVRALIESRDDYALVAETTNGRDAIEAARATQPNIAIIDYSMPGMNGLDLTIALKRELPRIEILIYTMWDREEMILGVLRAGARGILLKSDNEQLMFAAIDSLAVHRPWFSPAVSEALLGQFLSSDAGSEQISLTQREREVVQLVAEGRINREISETLHISVKTVETHRASAMHKLNLRTTADLVRYAVRNSIIGA